MIRGPYAGIEPVADYFGVSSSTIRHWVRSKKIPESAYIKVSTTYRFHIRAVEDALLNYNKRRDLDDAQRNALADAIIKGIDIDVFGDSPEGVSEEVVEEANDKLDAQVEGVPHVAIDPEVDAALDAILDEIDEPQQ